MIREMKDSSVEWIGEIPEDWDIERCKYNFAYHKDIAGMDSINYERLALTMRGVIKRAKEDTDGLQPESFDGYQIANEGDLIFKLIDLAGKSTSRVGLSPYTGLVSPAYILLHANDKKMSKEYAQYFFLSMWYRLIFNQIGNGGIRSSLNATDLLEVPITTPKLTEQTQIVHFLDRKCTAIDTAIEKTKKSIVKLEEYKKAVITKAVTKGIDPNAKMKDSGVEWCPQIPEHWSVVNPKALFSQRTERILPGDKQLTASQEHGIIYQDEYTKATGSRVVAVIRDFSILKHVEPNDFVISMRSFQGGLEYSEKRGCISSAYVMLIPNTKYVYPPFYRWFFKSSKYINALQSTSNFVRDGQAMRYSHFIQIPLFVIPLTEQKQIANYLESKVNAIMALIQKKQMAITKWEEYKKSLIYYAVTGKIDCRNEVI